MSLKSFHILFISVSSLLCFGFAWWSLITTGTYKTLGVCSLLVGLVLLVYGPLFLQKMKRIEPHTTIE